LVSLDSLIDSIWLTTAGSSKPTSLACYARSITPELARAGVRVTLISPGFVASNIRKVDNSDRFHAEASEPMPAWLVVDTQRACCQILRAVAAGRAEAIITGHGKLLVAIERFAPWILRAAGRRMAARGRGHRPEPDTR
jgi:short-subunit dehydrogenase